MTAYRHVIFRITIVAFLAAFLTFIPGCGGDEEDGASDEDASNLAPGYRAVESEGRDEATGLWKEIVHEYSGIVLRLVPAGEFDMGSPDSDDDRSENEGPVHRVKISEPFYIGKYEVTNEQFCRFLNAKAAHSGGGNIWLDLDDEDCRVEKRGDEYRPKSGYAGHPVTDVSWWGSKAFGEWVGGRLPSEAEWEYACRAGSKKKWCFGDNEDTLGEYAWYADNSGKKTHEIGTRKANEWGLYDMHGNVWEFCEDSWHSNYNGAPDNGRVWTTDGEEPRRVCRGGSWGVLAGRARSALRDWLAPDVTGYYDGFRVVVAAGKNT